MNRLFLVSLLALVTLGTRAWAEELVLDDVQLDSLGIEFTAPEPADASMAASAPARVIVPPSADHIVASSVAGLVEKVFVGVGDRVTAGQPLVSIRSPEFLGLQQQYLSATAEASLAAAQLDRDRQLFDEGIIAERRLQETRAQATSAASLRAEHARLLSIAGLRKQDIAALERGVELIDKLVIRAPVDGVVLDLMTRAGQSVDSVGALCEVADLSVLWLDIRVPQQVVGRVAVGAEVAVRESPAARPAKVMAIGGAVDPETQTVPVRAELTQQGHGLRPGQLVGTTILAARSGDADMAPVSLPTAALMRSGDAAYVFVRSAAGVEATPVTVVAASGQRVVVSGLPRGALAAVTGVSALKALWLSTTEAEG